MTVTTTMYGEAWYNDYYGEAWDFYLNGAENYAVEDNKSSNELWTQASLNNDWHEIQIWAKSITGGTKTTYRRWRIRMVMEEFDVGNRKLKML